MDVTYKTRLKIAALSAAGRNPFCGFEAAVREYDRSLRQHQVSELIRGECRTVAHDRGLTLWSTPSGEFWAPDSTGDRALSMILAEQTMHAYEETELKPGDVVLDCGANIGAFSRAALDRGASRVVAVEPFPPTAECLRRNLATDIAAGRAIICQTGLWHQEEVRTIFVDPHNAGGNSFLTRNPDAYEGDQIPLTTIDALVAGLGLTRLDFIKMDIEAAEQNALRGARETLGRFRPRMAVAVEHSADRRRNAEQVASIVRNLRNDYGVRPGFCYFTPDHYILPEVLYFT